MTYEEAAAKLGMNVAELKAFNAILNAEAKTEAGNWTTNINGIITHTDGSRHWSSQSCETCKK
jgi:hypothetical protein